MRVAIEGSQAIARALALCRLQVVAAYPITPQTHIVEGLAKLVADGKADCEVVSVESEFSAASVALGAAAAGSRAYCATASQGVLLMSEVLYNIAGLRLPVVLTVANRAVGAPINIWNDHQDSMAVRDAGWVQIYCSDNQDAVDTTIKAFRIAEALEVPVMVCVDGFILTHLFEAIDLPPQAEVDSFLPAYRFSRRLDSRAPMTLGTMVGPDHFTEARLSLHYAVEAALDAITAADRDWQAVSGRDNGGHVRVEGDPAADVGVLTIGSVAGTLSEALDENPGLGPLRLLSLRTFRPFPVAAVRAACRGLRDLVVLERAMSPGAGAIVATEIRAALYGVEGAPRVHAFAGGLGGRNLPLATLAKLVAAAGAEQPVDFAIIDAEASRIAPEDLPKELAHGQR
jgi:pyruvate ferredoxin oxidoreductase alpha subunit